jgi:hypothetical protein
MRFIKPFSIQWNVTVRVTNNLPKFAFLYSSQLLRLQKLSRPIEQKLSPPSSFCVHIKLLRPDFSIRVDVSRCIGTDDPLGRTPERFGDQRTDLTVVRRGMQSGSNV